VVTLLAAATAVGLLIAPAAYHRMVFRQHRKSELVRVSGRLALAGLSCLLLAIAGAVFVVMDVVVGLVAATVAAAALGVGYLGVWYVLPLRHRRRPWTTGPDHPGGPTPRSG
jgi:O-antigen/teichoic acid export membrane protein